MNDVMLDFETLGNGTNKCICQVGACYFDRVTGEIGATFAANIDAATHEALGGRLDSPTVYWWLAQSDVARASLLANKRPIRDVFVDLNEFLKDAKRIWSHATFDFVTLMETNKQLGLKPPYNYKSGLDIRTLVYLANVSFDKTAREGVHHNGLDDCKHQVKYCVAALNALKTSKTVISFLNNLVGE